VGDPPLLLAPAEGPENPLLSYRHRALGTWNTLLLADPGPDSRQETDRAAQAAFVLLDRLEDELSRFRSESEVSLLNALGASRPVPVGRALFEILETARKAWEETGGAFDPTVGPLMDAWGFPRGPARVPPPEEIARLLLSRGMDHLILDREAHTARFDREGVAIDLGAIGKGYAVDRLQALLRERGVPAGAIVSGRSTIALWGRPRDPWRLAVVHPESAGETIATLEVEEGSVSTSGAYEEKFVHQGVEYGHLLDPRTGSPVRSATRSVTVWTPTALEGDVLSTAFFVLGPGEARRLLEGRRASAAFVLDDPSAWGGLRIDTFHSGPPAQCVIHSRVAKST